MSVTKRDLEKIKQMLLERKQELEDKLSQLSKEKVTDDQVQDPGDQAISSSMELLRNSFQDAEIRDYQRIVLALDKIADGSYGICVDCGQDIAAKRLESNPNATRCLSCQEAFEDADSRMNY